MQSEEVGGMRRTSGREEGKGLADRRWGSRVGVEVPQLPCCLGRAEALRKARSLPSGGSLPNNPNCPSLGTGPPQLEWGRWPLHSELGLQSRWLSAGKWLLLLVPK